MSLALDKDLGVDTVIWLLWLSTVSAAPPDKMPVAFTVGSGVVSDLTVSDDGALIGATSGGSATLLDVNTWTVESVLPCSVEAVTFVTLEDSSLEFWVGCADGPGRRERGHT